MILLPVVLCGGIGSRLWPLSRSHRPKHSFPVIETEFSLFQETLIRISKLTDSLNIVSPIVVCNEKHRFLMAQQLQDLNVIGLSSTVQRASILLEPEGKNTAPAIALAALEALQRYPYEKVSLLILPADHAISDDQYFSMMVNNAMPQVSDGHIVTFGVKPTRAETGYGYIQGNEKGDVVCFTEKPTKEIAQDYLKSGDFYWNSGVFLVDSQVYLEELDRYRADIYNAVKKAYLGRNEDIDFVRIDNDAFKLCPAESIDHAVMESTTLGKVLPYHSDWSDIGAWDSVYDFSLKDEQRNVLFGDVVVQNTQDSFIKSESRLVTAVGVSNVVIIETSDAVLVANKDYSQDVKVLVDRLTKEQRNECVLHTQVHRPWGSYEKVNSGLGYQVKKITVKPRGKLSVQLHHHRAEHWVVVSGQAMVRNGDSEFVLSANESTYIPAGTVHSLENFGTEPLEVIEVQSGSYLGEDDIVRFSDRYGR